MSHMAASAIVRGQRHNRTRRVSRDRSTQNTTPNTPGDPPKPPPRPEPAEAHPNLAPSSSDDTNAKQNPPPASSPFGDISGRDSHDILGDGPSIRNEGIKMLRDHTSSHDLAFTSTFLGMFGKKPGTYVTTIENSTATDIDANPSNLTCHLAIMASISGYFRNKFNYNEADVRADPKDPSNTRVRICRYRRKEDRVTLRLTIDYAYDGDSAKVLKLLESPDWAGRLLQLSYRLEVSVLYAAALASVRDHIESGFFDGLPEVGLRLISELYDSVYPGDLLLLQNLGGLLLQNLGVAELFGLGEKAWLSANMKQDLPKMLEGLKLTTTSI